MVKFNDRAVNIFNIIISEMTENYSRKERERQFRRNDIISVAIKIFAEKGFNHTTLDEIAEISEYGKGTIYNYFDSKEDLYLGIIEKLFSDQLAEMEKLDTEVEDPREYLKKLTYSFVDYCLSNKDEFKLLLRIRLEMFNDNWIVKSVTLEEIHDRIIAIYRNVFIKGMDMGIIRSMDLDALIILYRNLILPYIYNLIFCLPLEKVDMERESEFIVSILFNGILTQKGAEI